MADRGNIYKITPAGLRTTFASGLDRPTGLAFDSAGNLFVTTGDVDDDGSPSTAPARSINLLQTEYQLPLPPDWTFQLPWPLTARAIYLSRT